MESVAERRLGSWLFAAAGSTVLVRWVTMRSLPLPFDGGQPVYGFPLPAFGWTGVSSGIWWFAGVPLMVDLAVSFAVLAPVVWLVAHRLRSRVVLAAGILVLLLAIGVHAETFAKLALGYTRPHVWTRAGLFDAGACRTPWVGEPTSTIDWSDPTDSCVREASAALGARSQ